MFPKQSPDVVAVHMGEQNEIDALRKNAALFKFTEHPAPFSSVPCVHQNDFPSPRFNRKTFTEEGTLPPPVKRKNSSSGIPGNNSNRIAERAS